MNNIKTETVEFDLSDKDYQALIFNWVKQNLSLPSQEQFEIIMSQTQNVDKAISAAVMNEQVIKALSRSVHYDGGNCKFLPDNRPSFCFIAPFAYLEKFAVASRTHLVLAHLVDQSEKYSSFYKNLRETRGDLVIMDNGAYELGKPYEPERLIDLAAKCGANVAVLPDYPFAPSNYTIEAAEQHIDKFKQAGLKTMFVPQSSLGNLEDWLECYQWGVGHEDVDMIGMSILGIPNALPNIDKSYARVVMTQILMTRGLWYPLKHHHYLGLNAGPGLELPTLLRMGAIDTIDSSNPIWNGIMGQRYDINTDSYMHSKKIPLPVDFTVEYDSKVKDIIQYNINVINDIFKNSPKERYTDDY